MKNCPTCGASVENNLLAACRRCSTDFSSIRKVEHAASIEKKLALEALSLGLMKLAYDHAEKACFLEANTETLRVLILALLSNKQYTQALNIWAYLMRHHDN